jgi:ABC-type phosphate transport system auxiliary subunit
LWKIVRNRIFAWVFDWHRKSAGARVSKKSKVMGQSFELLSVEERAQQYREMADATFLKAQKLEDPALKTQYLNMASSWHALAQELETGNADPETAPPEKAGPDQHGEVG